MAKITATTPWLLRYTGLCGEREWRRARPMLSICTRELAGLFSIPATAKRIQIEVSNRSFHDVHAVRIRLRDDYLVLWTSGEKTAPHQLLCWSSEEWLRCLGFVEDDGDIHRIWVRVWYEE